MNRMIKPFAALTIVFFLLLALCSCGVGQDPGEVKETEAAPTASSVPQNTEAAPTAPPAPLHSDADFNNSLDMYASLAETDDAFVWCPGSGSGLLRYFDKAAWEAGDPEPYGVLCGRPECSHTGTSCDAMIEDVGRSLTLMDGRLYWVRLSLGTEYRYAVYSAKPDLSDKKLETYLKFGYEVQPQKMCFHRGAVYVVSVVNKVGKDAVPYHSHQLISCDLKTGEPTVLLDYETVNALPEFNLRFLGTKVYYTEGLYVQGCDFSVYCYDTADGTLEVLLSHCHTIDTAAYVWIDDDGTVYVGDYGLTATVFRISDGELVPVTEFEQYYRTHPFEKAAVGVQKIDGEMYGWFKSYGGETLFKGILPTETIEGGLDGLSAYWVCGDGEYIIIQYYFSVEKGYYLVRYDLRDGEITETLMGHV